MASRRKSTSLQHAQRQRQTMALGMVGFGFILLAVAIGLLWKDNSTGKVAAAPVSSAKQAASNAELPPVNSTIPSRVSFPAPDLALSDTMGAKRALSDYAGQVVLVNNWAIWCPPCKAEIPHLEAFYQAHQDEGLVIIGIDAGDAENKVTEFIAQAGITYPIWFDPDGKAMNAFQNAYLPSSYVIDRSGTVIMTWTGSISLDVLETYVTPLLAD